MLSQLIQRLRRVQIQAHGWHQLMTTCLQVRLQLRALQRQRLLQLLQLLQQLLQQQHEVDVSEGGVENSIGGEMANVYR